MNNQNHSAIFAKITGVGGSISIFRISGKNIDSLSAIIPYYKKLKHRFASIADIIDIQNNGDILDSALITFFKSPNSFTGENVVEISCHGSSYIQERLFILLKEVCGFRFAEGGEFSKRAFLNGKMDIIQAEGINALVNSQAKTDHKVAMEMLYGNNSKKYKKWRDDIIGMLTKLDASIDFDEEEVQEVDIEAIKLQKDNLKKSIKRHIEGSIKCKKVGDGINIGIFGKPNAGKSSLLNAMVGEDIAIVASKEGTTRDIVSMQAKIADFPVSFFDTAGIRDADDEIEAKGITRALNKKSTVDISLVVYDILDFKNATEDQIKLVFRNSNTDKSRKRILLEQSDIVLFNKIDLLSKDDFIQIKNTIKNVINNSEIVNKVIFLSTETRTGIDEVFRKIEEDIEKNFSIGIDGAILSQRNLEMLEECYKMLEMLTLNDSVEIIANQLHSVANKLSLVVGDVKVDDILDNIFSNFCIGK